MIDIAIHAAREAGKILLQHLGNLQHIEIKNGQDLNLVTEADKESERRIIDIITT
ncbi:MAG: inositol monophosphatase, partial [Chlorobi bacterium]|nr:inositol monophosphatase [Chlorobiota bacterium]